MQLKIVKGTRDLLDDEVRLFQFLESKARQVFELYGFEEIRTPIMEQVELFAHGVGEETDIVGKEMYLLKDRNDQALALRPEGTAAVVRSVITNQTLKQKKQIRYYYMGPMFRYERPQKGRYRQFHQIGVEFFGVDTPEADLELFLMLRHYFKEIQLEGVAFQLNNIGCNQPECRPAFKQRLIEDLRTKKSELCEDCQRRLETNPLRVLDCKVERCIELTNQAPKVHDHVCPSCESHFSRLQELLKEHGIYYELNAKLVRGLDYYSKTVFEVYSSNLGAQSAAGGGGRFDGLFELYGEAAVPATGFALGLDRIALLAPLPPKTQAEFFVIGHEPKALSQVVANLRQAGLKTHYDPFYASMKSQFKQAGKLEVAAVIILGEEELKEGKLSIKNMATGEQTQIPQAEVVEFIQKLTKTPSLC